MTAIIPTFRRPVSLRKAVLSALGQTHAKLAVIVVIDGPDDETRATIERLQHPSLRIVELKKNVGAAEARNVGVGLAASEWVAFLDDDDEWLPRKIALQMEAARGMREKYPVISTRTVVRTPAFDWISPRDVYSSKEPMSEFLFCRRSFVDGARYMQTSSLMMRRELMLDLPFRRNLKRHQDWDWLLRAATHPDVGFQMLPEALSIFYVGDSRESLGRALDWQFSQAWAREMQQRFTPRAYSFFLATECMSRAVKSHAGGMTYSRLVWEFFAQGRPTPRALLNLAGFLFVPQRLRGWLRSAVRRCRMLSAKKPEAHSALPA